MNIDTGRIVSVLGDLTEAEAKQRRLIAIEGDILTEKQTRVQLVSLHDHRSPAGRILTAARKADRSKYRPHVGKKQLAKIARGQGISAVEKELHI